MGPQPSSLKEWAHHLLSLEDDRFRTDPLFVMLIGNQIQRHTALTMGRVVGRDLDKNMTVSELKEKVAAEDFDVIEKLRYYSAAIPGSGQYFYNEQKKLKVLFDHH